jgi:hypothetical protein
MNRIFKQSDSPQRDAYHARDGGVHPVEGVAAAPAITGNPLAALLAGHVLSDGELILLIIKPSVWFILLSSLRFLAAVAILVIAAKVFDEKLPYNNAVYFEAGVFLMAGRIMFAVLQWMGRVYILTDLRILRLSGVFRLDLYACPLRKVARTRVVYTPKERILGLGSIEIFPGDESIPDGVWYMIARPRRIHEQVVAAINRAKQTGRACSLS